LFKIAKTLYYILYISFFNKLNVAVFRN